MNDRIGFIDKADAYIRGEMNREERELFERLCDEDPEKGKILQEQMALLGRLQDYQVRKTLRAKLNSIYDDLDLSAIRKSASPKPSLKTLWMKHRQTALIAASVALLAVFSTLWVTGFYSEVKESSSKYSALKRDMNNIQKNVSAQNAVINTISSNVEKSPRKVNPSTYGATGFALTSNGFLVTNYHVIKDADSVYVQNSEGESLKAKVVYIDPSYDLAVLEITDPAFKNTVEIPYTFKDKASDIGQDVFTIGYPREEAVYGSGYLSSKTGYGGDTIAYQVTIPVNPGNSGGPVLDDKGNVIGIISGKQTEADGVAFAIKTDYLLKSIHAIPQDSLTKALNINKKNTLAGLPRTKQIKKIQDHIYIVKVY